MEKIWIGLCHVIPKKGFDNLIKGMGAFVNIVAISSNRKEFEILARETLSKYGFEMIDIQDVETLSERAKKVQISDSILELAQSLNETYPIQFDSFHSYEQ